jgi:hypothetical protein
MNFFFHGASVTQQSGQSSYFHLLNEIVNNAYILSKKGYGGCHFNDAGFLTFRTDIPSDTNVCILEWNTTGLSEFNEDKLKYVAGYLIDKKITPVFLILARKDNILKPRICDLQVLNFCSQNNILCLDYRSKILPDKHLRDEVHTNEAGAKVYANSLFSDIFLKINYFSFFYPTSFKYRDFIIDSHRDTVFDAAEGQKIVLEINNISIKSEIILEVIIGPSSPIVDVNGTQKMCFWDRWCHYERPSFKAILLEPLSLNSEAIIDLNILSDLINYSDCVREFSFQGEKTLKVRGVHGLECFISNIYLK